MNARQERISLAEAARRLGWPEPALRRELALHAGVLQVGHVQVLIGAARQLAPADRPQTVAALGTAGGGR